MCTFYVSKKSSLFSTSLRGLLYFDKMSSSFNTFILLCLEVILRREGRLLSGFWNCSHLRVLPGFWNCSQGFGFMKSTLKGYNLKPKIEKRALLPLFYCLCSDICRKKNIVFLRYLNNLMIFWYSAGHIEGSINVT